MILIRRLRTTLKEMGVTVSTDGTNRVFGNVRTVFSGAKPDEKIRAIRDIGYCAVGAGLLVAGLSSFVSPDSSFALLANSSPIVATIVGGIWAALKT
jgi:hypothetical protein